MSRDLLEALRRLLSDPGARFAAGLRLKRLMRVGRAVLRDQVTYYPRFVEAFERSFADYVGCRHGVTFSNGTASLEAALFALGVHEGDEVLVPAHTFHASINAIWNAGARPVFADIDPATQTLDPEEIARRSSPQTRCVLVVHLFGNPADMRRILELSHRHGLAVIEDCSHAHGASLDGRKVGAFGDIGCFSLQGNKAVSAGEGGIAVTDSDRLFQRLCLFGHYGRHHGQEDTVAAELRQTGAGHKRRANPLGICMAQVDLEHLERRNAARRRVAAKLVELLDPIAGLCPVTGYPGAVAGGFYPGLPVQIAGEMARSVTPRQLVEHLDEHGIRAARYPYAGYHEMPHMVDPAWRRALLFGSDGGTEPPPAELPRLPATSLAQQQTFLLLLPEPGGVLPFARLQAALSETLPFAVE